tara:strand:- start:4249 stop:4575 length:327 start_codon:yes stop_codon:yes gene_type:complete
MSDETKYGKNDKRIVFTDTDHRHAQLLVRLRTDGMKQAQFFRSLITGYIEQDDRIVSFFDDIKDQSIKRKDKSNRLRKSGQQLLNDTGFSDEQIQDIFDLIAEEHPEL